MTTLSHCVRFRLVPQRAPFRVYAPTAAQERATLFIAALAFLAGGAAVALHALSAVVAFS